MKTKEKVLFKSIALMVVVFMIMANTLPISSYAMDKVKTNSVVKVTLTSSATQIKAGDTVYVDVHITGDNIASFAGTLDYDTNVFQAITSKTAFVIPTALLTNTGYGEWSVAQYGTTTKTLIVSEANGDYYTLPGDGLLFRIPLVAKTDAATSVFNIKGIQVDAATLNTIDIVTINLPSSTVGSHTLSIDANGGTYTGSETTVSMTQGETKDLGTPTRDGYTFTGWQITNSGSTATLNGNNITMGNEDVNVQAQWQNSTVSTYTLIVDPNSGTYTGSTVFDLDVGEATALETPTRDGYTFLGWEIVTSPTTATISGNVVTMGNENIVVRAKWQLISTTAYTLTLDLNGGTSTDVTTYQLETGESKTLIAPTKAGYTFAGWEIITSPTTATISDSVITMGSENITLKAKWIEKLYLKAKTYQIDTTNTSSYIIGTTKEYVTNDKYILNIASSTTLQTFISRLDTNGTISVKKTSGTTIGATELVGTGMTLEVTGTEGTIDLSIVVAGDLDGDGKCSITDLSRMNNILNQSITVTDAYKVAADMDYSGSVTISDLSRLNQHMIGNVINLIKINN